MQRRLRQQVKKTVRAFICIAVVLIVAIVGSYGLKALHDKYIYDTYPLKYQTEVEAASKKYGVDKYLIYGIIKTESDFDPDAVSPAGAIGLMQITPDTFEWIQTYYVEEEYKDYTVDDLYNSGINIDYGTNILSVLLDMYGNEDTAVCAYNAGIGHVDSWLEDENYSDDGKTLKEVPFGETENYRHIVAQNKSCYIRLYNSTK